MINKRNLNSYSKRRRKKKFSMGKFPKPLNTPNRSSEPHVVETTTPEEHVDLDSLDPESSYLSICCLLQTESAASLSLVTEYDMLTKIVDKLVTGAPRDIEELSLSAISSSLSWLPFSVFERCATNGLVELCYQLIVRFVTRRDLKTLDKSCEIAMGILSDVSRLDSRVCNWGIGQMDFFVKIATDCPCTYPSIVIKRSVLRLIYTLVSESEVPTELSSEYWSLMTSCSDLEVRCFLLMTALHVNQPNLCEFDLPAYLNESIKEASTFTGEDSSDEEELRLSNWRSKIRGLGSFLTYLGDAIVVDDEEDSVENKKFSNQHSFNDLPAQEIYISLSASNLNSIVDSLTLVCSRINEKESQEEATERLLVLEDSDLRNVFDTVSFYLKITGHLSFRMNKTDNEIVSAVYRICQITMKLDLEIYANLLSECTVVIWTFLLSVVAGKNAIPSGTPLCPVVVWMNEILAQYWVHEGISIGEGDLINIFDSLQMIFTLGQERKCAETMISVLSSIRAEKISPDSVCALAECVFVVFSESDSDNELKSIDLGKILNDMTLFLKPHSSEYIKATVSNIKAFMAYKK